MNNVVRNYTALRWSSILAEPSSAVVDDLTKSLSMVATGQAVAVHSAAVRAALDAARLVETRGWLA